MNQEYIVQTHQLTKVFHGFTAVDGINLHIKRGTVYGFLGPNGAGKSTTMKLLLGLLKPTQGTCTIDHMMYPKDRIEILKKTGSLIEAPAYYGNLTGKENLEIIQKVLGAPASRVDEILRLVGLEEYWNRQVKHYSIGMKQRLGLAGALIGNPSLVLLDEPTNGLDPVGIYEIRNLIRSLPQMYGCTVVVSSHLLSEIELIADNLGILNHGHMLYEGSLEGLKRKAVEKGYPMNHLEDTFLAMIEEDNKK